MVTRTLINSDDANVAAGAESILYLVKEIERLRAALTSARDATDLPRVAAIVEEALNV
jgi:hypothetical protein